MFQIRRPYNEINSTQERALWITYPENMSTFHERLSKYRSASENRRNFQFLEREMYKINPGLSPEILRETFVSRKVCIIFAEAILLKDLECTQYFTVVIRYRFQVQKHGI